MIRMAMAALLLAGCATNGAAAPESAEVPGKRCDSNAAASLVGKQAVDVAAEALRLSGAGSIRQYRTGDAVTQDFRADRLNIETDANGAVVKFSCG